MGERTGIEWTDATWNVVTGCTRVSRGCDHCYIVTTPPFRTAHRTFDKPGIGGTTGVLLHPDRLGWPLRTKWREPRRIFVNSLADLFHNEVPDELIARTWIVMALTPQHVYQVLTKRPSRMRSLLSSGLRWRTLLNDALEWVVDNVAAPMPPRDFDAVREWLIGDGVLRNEPVTPLPNVHIGVSVEDQAAADLRIPTLLDTPAAVRWLSMEPLLGPVDLFGPTVGGHRPRLHYWLVGRPSWGREEIQPSGLAMQPLEIGPKIDWIVVGGETKAGARPMHPEWVRTVRDQCGSAGVPFHFKQWGDWVPRGRLRDGVPLPVDNDRTLILNVAGNTRGLAAGSASNHVGEFSDGSHCEIMERVGKKAAGRTLDGREWDEEPA